MSYGLKIIGRDGTVRLDTSDATEVLIDEFTLARGASITKDYANLPSDMVLRAVLVQVTDVEVNSQQVVPTFDFTDVNANLKRLTVTGRSTTINTSQLDINDNFITASSKSAAVNVLVIGT